MGCFPPACGCFGHWKHKQAIRHQSLSSSEKLQEAAKVLAAATMESIKEEEIASLLQLVAQPHVENDEQTNGSEENQSNGVLHNDVNTVEHEIRSVENKREDELLTLDPAASEGPEDVLVIDKEALANAGDDNPKGDVGIRDCCCPVQMESSESLFSLSIDSRKHFSAAEIGDKEVSSRLKPLQNSSHVGKENVNLEKSSYKDKENLYSEGRWTVPHSKQAAVVKESSSKLDEITAADTSLSSWLAGSEKTPPCKASSGSSPESEKNYSGRQILEVISPAEELKQLKDSTPCSSADDHLGFGTVGRYWQQTGVARQ